jgi:2-polyprenyl-3-methyl-5-hydroxy-6-metoxy-1,4-benzoquinol methylase
LDFAKWRVNKRNLNNIKFLTNEDSLPEKHFDIVICLDVLEHVSDPIYEIKRITKSLKPHGLIALEVSKKKKSTSGHFSKSIDMWNERGLKFMKTHYSQVIKQVWRKNN